MGGPGSGHHLEPVLRKLIFHHYLYLLISPEDIHDTFFSRADLPGGQCFTLDRLRRLCRWFNQYENPLIKTEIDKYLSGEREGNAGRPHGLTSEDREYLKGLLRVRCTHRLGELAQELYLMIDNEEQQIPSISSVYRELRSMKFSRKIYR